MSKLDDSSGLTLHQISEIKRAIKNVVKSKLPLMSEPVEVKLFLQGRDAWTYSWDLLDQDTQNPLHPMTVALDVKLKKEFHQHLPYKQFSFLCKLQLQPDSYSPVKSIRKTASF